MDMDMDMDKQFFSELAARFVNFCISSGIKLLAAMLLLAVGFKLVRMFTRFLKKSHGMSRMDGGVKTFTINFINVTLKILLIVTAASIVGFPTASVVTVVGSAGVAIGLALQGSLSNIAGGLILLIFKPFNVGDFISVEGESGTVEEIGMFYTKITTPDNRRVIFPNGTVSNEKMVNVSANKIRRADFLFSVSYDSDLDRVKEILNAAVSQCKFILDDPAPIIFLSEQADSALVFAVNVWCDSDKYLNLKYDFSERVKRAFDLGGIQIPYPQLDVHFEK